MIYSLKLTDDIPMGGQTFMWMIKLKEKYRNDQGLLEHEKLHVRQFWIMTGCVAAVGGLVAFWFYPALILLVVSPFAHNATYGICRPYRQWCEVSAYKKQLEYPPAVGDLTGHYKNAYAGFLSDRYGLGISPQEALELIQ